MLQLSDNLHGLPPNPLQQLQIFLMLGLPALVRVLQTVSHKGRAEMDNHLPHLSIDAAQDTVRLLGCKLTVLPCAQLFSSVRTPKFFSVGLLSMSSSSLYLCPELLQPQCSTLHSEVNFPVKLLKCVKMQDRCMAWTCWPAVRPRHHAHQEKLQH